MPAVHPAPASLGGRVVQTAEHAQSAYALVVDVSSDVMAELANVPYIGAAFHILKLVCDKAQQVDGDVHSFELVAIEVETVALALQRAAGLYAALVAIAAVDDSSFYSERALGLLSEAMRHALYLLDEYGRSKVRRVLRAARFAADLQACRDYIAVARDRMNDEAQQIMMHHQLQARLGQLWQHLQLQQQRQQDLQHEAAACKAAADLELADAKALQARLRKLLLQEPDAAPHAGAAATAGPTQLAAPSAAASAGPAAAAYSAATPRPPKPTSAVAAASGLGRRQQHGVDEPPTSCLGRLASWCCSCRRSRTPPEALDSGPVWIKPAEADDDDSAAASGYGSYNKPPAAGAAAPAAEPSAAATDDDGATDEQDEDDIVVGLQQLDDVLRGGRDDDAALVAALLGMTVDDAVRTVDDELQQELAAQRVIRLRWRALGESKLVLPPVPGIPPCSTIEDVQRIWNRVSPHRQLPCMAFNKVERSPRAGDFTRPARCSSRSARYLVCVPDFRHEGAFFVCGHHKTHFDGYTRTMFDLKHGWNRMTMTANHTPPEF